MSRLKEVNAVIVTTRVYTRHSYTEKYAGTFFHSSPTQRKILVLSFTPTVQIKHDSMLVISHFDLYYPYKEVTSISYNVTRKTHITFKCAYPSLFKEKIVTECD